MSHSVNPGNVDALEIGIVDSAGIMVPCAWCTQFARNHPEYAHGIHLGPTPLEARR